MAKHTLGRCIRTAAYGQSLRGLQMSSPALAGAALLSDAAGPDHGCWEWPGVQHKLAGKPTRPSSGVAKQVGMPCERKVKGSATKKKHKWQFCERKTVCTLPALYRCPKPRRRRSRHQQRAQTNAERLVGGHACGFSCLRHSTTSSLAELSLKDRTMHPSSKSCSGPPNRHTGKNL